MIETNVFQSEIESFCNMICSWLTFLSCWCSNIADDDVDQDETTFVYTLIFIQKRTSNLLNCKYVRVKVDQHMIISSTLVRRSFDDLLRVIIFVKESQISERIISEAFRIRIICEALSRVVRTSLIEFALTDDLLKKVKIECLMMLLSLSCYALIFSHFLFLKSLKIAIDFRLHLFCFFFVQYMC